MSKISLSKPYLRQILDSFQEHRLYILIL